MRRGAALAAVLLAMTLVSALAVGGVFVARQLSSSARLVSRASDLLPTAEGVLVEAVGGWDSTVRARQPVGTTQRLPASQTTATQVEAWITRTGETTYWLVAEATSDVRPRLRRRIGLVVRLSEGLPTPALPYAWSQLP